MFIFGANVKQIATGYPVRTIVKDMQSIAAPDQNQLAKLVGMVSLDIVGITIGHGECVLVLRKIVCFRMSQMIRHHITSTCTLAGCAALIRHERV